MQTNQNKITIYFLLFFVFLLFMDCEAKTTAFYVERNIQFNNNIYTSSVIYFDIPMTQAVLSWNVITPEDSYVELQLRAKKNTTDWSRWFGMGIWGTGIQSKSIKNQESDFAKVDIDTLMLNKGARYWQFRVIAHNSSNNKLPIVYAMALAAKNNKYFKTDQKLKTSSLEPISVPVLSQFEDGKDNKQLNLASRICSPTSVAMLLKHQNVLIPSLTDFVFQVYDHGADAFGNWPFNVAVIFYNIKINNPEKSVVAYVKWFEAFDELLNVIRKGYPAIVSIAYKKGDLDDAPKPTSGHLLLIRGANDKYVYVNDPAAPDRKSVSRKYKRDQFVKAWKGIAYIVEHEKS